MLLNFWLRFYSGMIPLVNCNYFDIKKINIVLFNLNKLFELEMFELSLIYIYNI